MDISMIRVTIPMAISCLCSSPHAIAVLKVDGSTLDPIVTLIKDTVTLILAS